MQPADQLPPDAVAELQSHSVRAGTIALVAAFMTELREAARREADGFDKGIGHGQLGYGWNIGYNARNCLANRIHAGEFGAESGIGVTGTELGQEFHSGPTAVHAWSAGEGQAPTLDGRGGRKKRVLQESKLRLFEAESFDVEPNHFVIAYLCDVLGLCSARGGVVGSDETYAWSVELHRRRHGEDFAGIDRPEDPPVPPNPNFDERRVEQPEIRLKGRRDENEAR